MSLVILDLEWNTAFCKELNRYVNEIVEFGAIKLDSKLNEEGRFSCLVKPTVAKGIHPQVKKLLKIDFSELKRAEKTFPYVIDDFAEFLGDSTLLTWSNTDLHTLLDNCELHFMEDNLPFLKSFCDLQKYCEYSLGVSSAFSPSTYTFLPAISISKPSNFKISLPSDFVWRRLVTA